MVHLTRHKINSMTDLYIYLIMLYYQANVEELSSSRGCHVDIFKRSLQSPSIVAWLYQTNYFNILLIYRYIEDQIKNEKILKVNFI